MLEAGPAAGQVVQHSVRANTLLIEPRIIMATDRELVDALVRAAEKTLRRTLSQDERSRLVEHFNKTSGSTFVRAKQAIIAFGSLRENQIQERSAASDDTERAIQDLKDAADQWKPGT